jgi:hypothetical protein
MRNLLALITCLATAVFLASQPPGVRASDDMEKPDGKESDSLPVRLGKIPRLALALRPLLDATKTALIKKSIADLARIDSPDYGLSPTMSGTAFLPIAGQRQAGAMLLTHHRLESSEALRALVEMGPDALPFLLAALEDKTPTKLILNHDCCFGAMFLANEIGGNPINPVEVKVLGVPRTRKVRGFPKEVIHNYTVKVGDACLVAIGQIVGRGYQAVRYQPTACIVINSPTEDAALCKQVRDIWSSKNPAKRLFDSLLLDYATEGKWKAGESLDEWYVGGNLQVAATMRLLYYFPKETVPMIARRLQQLRVERTGPGARRQGTANELDAWVRREVANGARTDELVKAVAWCKEPAIRDALRSIVQRTDDNDVLTAVSLGMGQSYETLLYPGMAQSASVVDAPGWPWRTWLVRCSIAASLVLIIPCAWYCLRRSVHRE